MSVSDVFNRIIGGGLSAAEIKGQELKLNSEQAQITQALDKAYADLGRMVYAGEGMSSPIRSTYSLQFSTVANLMEQQNSVRQQIEDLQRNRAMRAAQSPNAPRYACPACGNAVTLAMPNCPNCGDNLATLKANFRMCPSCNQYYPSDAMFCEVCGSRTIDIPLSSPSHPVTPGGFAGSSMGTASADTQFEGEKLCPNCGEPVLPGAMFCGKCGTKV